VLHQVVEDAADTLVNRRINYLLPRCGWNVERGFPAASEGGGSRASGEHRPAPQFPRPSWLGQAGRKDAMACRLAREPQPLRELGELFIFQLGRRRQKVSHSNKSTRVVMMPLPTV
jgi:hypothetical protein